MARGIKSSHLIKHGQYVLRVIAISRTDVDNSQASTGARSRAWGTLSLLGVLLQARIPKRDIILIATVGCIWIRFSTGSGQLGGSLLLVAVWPGVDFGEVGIVVVLLIVIATISTTWPAIFLLLQCIVSGIFLVF